MWAFCGQVVYLRWTDFTQRTIPPGGYLPCFRCRQIPQGDTVRAYGADIRKGRRLSPAALSFDAASAYCSPSTETVTVATTSLCSAICTGVSPIVLSGPSAGGYRLPCQPCIPGLQRLDDVVCRNGTEQAAINAGLARDLQHQALQLLGLALRGSHGFRLDALELGSLLFEDLAVGVRCTLGLALRDQEVARIAVLDLDHVAEAAEVDHFFHQNHLHDRFLAHCAGRCRAAAPGSARA
jgi:hypothetical protein